jgi:hypothetical protein
MGSDHTSYSTHCISCNDSQHQASVFMILHEQSHKIAQLVVMFGNWLDKIPGTYPPASSANVNSTAFKKDTFELLLLLEAEFKLMFDPLRPGSLSVSTSSTCCSSAKTNVTVSPGTLTDLSPLLSDASLSVG